ncbi:hypothetical protein HYE67_010393 [Fusarium culmorum]|uniref:NACHT domain-containing protein n=1 Tax=Fusarium culmorum TaxID=5516 RepID=A0A7S8DGS4_FUSCU|nr:hypothetical protein HYE67_010393 [Fusarium culmorum]
MSGHRTITESQFGDSARIHLGDNNYNCKCCLMDSESDSRFLWIKGDPGKGKTMLLAGIIDKLNAEPGNFGQTACFFCQGTDSRINNATAVLRGLIYMLVKRQESLLTHVWKEYEHAGKQLFEDCNAFTALSRILHAILVDSNMDETVLAIDALDECVTYLHLLLDLLVDLSQQNVRWIVSSRNWPEIDVLHDAAQKLVLRLELNEASISQAVKLFIKYKVRTISTRKGLNTDTKLAIQEYMESNCSETFLWIALAYQMIEDAKLPGWKILTKLRETPAGLENTYRRMLDFTLGSHCKEDCKQILKLTLTAYRPMTLDELLSLWEPSEDTPFDKHILQQIVERAGSFLILKDDIVYFIHQLAKDYLIEEATEELDFVKHLQNYHIFNRCLIALNRNLRRNIYSLGYPGFSIEEVRIPEPDPLAPARCCCIYWASHLCDSDPNGLRMALGPGGVLELFLREKGLNWIEAMCLLQVLPDALRVLYKLRRLATAVSIHAILEQSCRERNRTDWL